MADATAFNSSDKGHQQRGTRSSGRNSDVKPVIHEGTVKNLVQQYSNGSASSPGPYYNNSDPRQTGKTTPNVQPRSPSSNVLTTKTNRISKVENTDERVDTGDSDDSWVLVEHEPKARTASSSSLILIDPKIGEKGFLPTNKPEANPAPPTKQENRASGDDDHWDQQQATGKVEEEGNKEKTEEDRPRYLPSPTRTSGSSSSRQSNNNLHPSFESESARASQVQPRLDKKFQSPDRKHDVEEKANQNYSNVEQALTYTPTYTIISEDLLKMVEVPGDKSKAIFFYHHISSSSRTLPQPTPFSIDNAKKWKNNDSSFVGVPFSSPERWKRIVRALTGLKEISDTERPSQIGRRVADAVKSYCREADSYDFEILGGRNISKHVAATIPIIVDQALMLPSLLARQVPVLECGQSTTLFVTKKLCCSLLANAFFSTFPPQRSNMPDINFHRLFSTSSSESRSNVKAEKIMCILNYFHQMTNPHNQEQFGNNIISFERRHRTQVPDWGKSTKGLTKVVVEPRKKIEEMDGMLQVDFANKVVGGGVLNDGAIMEEILFVISPELIISRLFTETLEDNEVMVITGAHQFSEYEGYSASFAFKKLFQFTNVGTDKLGRLCNQMVAMDALHFKGDPKVQFRQELIDRELQKSHVGFVHGAFNSPVATGNWGCGAFNGDTELKFLIQWLAATEAGRPVMHYHTVGGRQQGDSIEHIVDLFSRQKVDAGKLYKLIMAFYPDRFHYDSIFEFIERKLSKKSKSFW